MKIVAVDPRRVGIAGQADILLQVRPGTDGALALALIDVVIKQKLYDEVRSPVDQRFVSAARGHGRAADGSRSKPCGIERTLCRLG